MPEGTLDARRDAEKEINEIQWFTLGCCFTVPTYAALLITKAEVPTNGCLASDSSDELKLKRMIVSKRCFFVAGAFNQNHHATLTGGSPSLWFSSKLEKLSLSLEKSLEACLEDSFQRHLLSIFTQLGACLCLQRRHSVHRLIPLEGFCLPQQQ